MLQYCMPLLKKLSVIKITIHSFDIKSIDIVSNNDLFIYISGISGSWLLLYVFPIYKCLYKTFTSAMHGSVLNASVDRYI